MCVFIRIKIEYACNEYVRKLLKLLKRNSEETEIKNYSDLYIVINIYYLRICTRVKRKLHRKLYRCHYIRLCIHLRYVYVCVLYWYYTQSKYNFHIYQENKNQCVVEFALNTFRTSDLTMPFSNSVQYNRSW